MSNTRKEIILITASDLAANFMFYDRKEDEDLGRGEIEDAIKSGEITEAEIVNAFSEGCGFKRKDKG